MEDFMGNFKMGHLGLRIKVEYTDNDLEYNRWLFFGVGDFSFGMNVFYTMFVSGIKADLENLELNECDPDYDTLTPCTGFEDCCDRPVFESDILLDNAFHKLFVVAWDKDLARFRLSCITDNAIVRDFTRDVAQNYKIVGNIFDNPELLDVSKAYAYENNLSKSNN